MVITARVEAMEWIENDGDDYIFGLAGNAVLDAMVAKNRRQSTLSSRPKADSRSCAPMRASPTRRVAGKRPRKVVGAAGVFVAAGLRGETTSTGMRQEVDNPLCRHLAQRLGAVPLRGRLLPAAGQMENLIKLHKAQLASDRMVVSQGATANQVRLRAPTTAAFWFDAWRARPPRFFRRQTRLRDR